MYFVYVKNTDNISVFDDVIREICDDTKNIEIRQEARRCFRVLEETEKEMEKEDVLIISCVQSLGLSKTDIANMLEKFIRKENLLVIADNSSTWEYGVMQPMNKAVLSAVQKTILDNSKNIVEISEKTGKHNSGRRKLDFPESWDEMYEKWKNKEISSGEFMEKSGLKKATFYNYVTEYRNMQEEMEMFRERFGRA